MIMKCPMEQVITNSSLRCILKERPVGYRVIKEATADGRTTHWVRRSPSLDSQVNNHSSWLSLLIRDAKNKLGVLDGVVIFVAASCLFRATQDFQKLYFFPNEPKKSLMLSTAIGVGLLLLRGKDLYAIVQ